MKHYETTPKTFQKTITFNLIITSFADNKLTCFRSDLFLIGPGVIYCCLLFLLIGLRLMAIAEICALII